MKQSVFEVFAPAMIDFYKIMYPTGAAPKGLEFMYSNFTPRNAKYAPKFFEKQGAHGPIYEGNGYPIADYKMLFVGSTRVMKDFKELWDKFFELPANVVAETATDYIRGSLPFPEYEDQVIAMWKDLHAYGKLPLVIRTLPEGTRVPMQMPFMTVHSTEPKFAFLTNYVESYLSAEIWKTCVAASIAFEFRKLVEYYAMQTCDNSKHVPFQCHDFSMRGMSGVHDAYNTGIGHLSCFKGSDSLPAVGRIKSAYFDTDGVFASSIPATEHAVMCMYGQENEKETYRHLITEVYPKGPVAIVSDTWDYWNVITNTLPELKEEIMNRDGTLVIRPDSGDPVKIICGDPEAEEGSPEYKGSIECLYETFGGHVNETGYKVLDSHISLVYGDSITLQRAEDILSQLEKKGFASSNIVLGIGSYTYQMVTRDTFSIAGKSTFAIVNGEERHLIKSPKTDAAKKSARGLLMVLGKFSDPNAPLALEQDVPFSEWRKLEGTRNRKDEEGNIIDSDLLTSTPWEIICRGERPQSFSVVRERIDKQLDDALFHMHMSR